MRSPIPVSTRTRPERVSISRQLSAWSRRRLSSTSSSTRPPHRTHGTGPNNVPASDRKVPAWISPTRTPPPSSRAQSTASFIAIGLLPRDGSPRVGSRLDRSRGGTPMRSARTGPGTCEPSSRRAVRPIDRARHLEEADLADAPSPKYSAIGRLATFDSSSVRLPFQPGSTKPAVEWMRSPSAPETRLAFEALATRSSGSSTHSRVWPSTNSPGMQDERLVARSTVSISVRSGCGCRGRR